MGDDDYDDYSKELNQYKKSKDRGRGLFFVSSFRFLLFKFDLRCLFFRFHILLI